MHHSLIAKAQVPQDVNIVDKTDPRSLLNIVPPVVAQAIERIPDDLFKKTEEELREMMPLKRFTSVDRRLRTSFWREYNQAQDQKRMMNITNIFAGICSRTHFYGNALEEKVRLAYLLLPPLEYQIAMEESLLYSIEQLREAIEVAFDEFKKSKNPKMLDVIVKVTQMYDTRVKGAVIQKVEQKNLNVNMDAPSDQDAPPANIEDIDRKIEELHKRKRSLPITVDAEIVGEGHDT